MNLLIETEEVLTNHKKTWEDVRWVGDSTGRRIISIDNFKFQANAEYDDGYGSAEVNPYLVIVGDDWWLERGEYDGSEWWEFKILPVRVTEGHDHTFKVFDKGWGDEED